MTYTMTDGTVLTESEAQDRIAKKDISQEEFWNLFEQISAAHPAVAAPEQYSVSLRTDGAVSATVTMNRES